MTFHNAIILIKSVFYKDKNCSNSIFLEKCSYQLPKNNVNKISQSKECNICHYWYFLDKGFKFQPDVCDRCHDVLMMSMNLSYIGILNIHSADCRCIIRGIMKSEAIKEMQNINLSEKGGTL